jgi:hypothetical protein
MDINMKNLKKKYRFLLSAIIFGMVFTMLFGLQGCAVLTLIGGGKSSEVQSGVAEGQKGYDSAQGNNGRESDTPGKGSNAENGNGEQAAGVPENSGSGSEKQDGATGDSQNASGSQDADKKPVFLTYLDETGSFAFQYPADRLSLSSNLFVTADTSDYKLAIMKQRPDSLNSSYYYFDKQKIQEDIAALKEGKFGADIEYSYKPGQKVIGKDGRFLKEFVIFSRSDCDVCFERIVVFYEGGVQHLFVLQGDIEKLKESLSGYLVTDKKDCQGLAAWGDGKTDILYKELSEGSAPQKVQKWYDSFDEIIASLTFDSSKISDLKNNNKLIMTGKSIYDNMPEYKTELTASYPVFEDFKTPGYFDAVNSHIKDILDPWFAYFMESVKATLKDMPADAAWIFQLQADYAIEYYNGKIISLSFTDYTFTGGAHGSTISETYNYDLVNKKEIKLSDIFKPGSDYLKFVSDYCFEDIKRQNSLMGMDSMEDMIKPGVDPLMPENFERFLLAADSLAIRFDQYQVGPGAAGSYTVRIGYEKLKDLIDEDYAELLLK